MRQSQAHMIIIEVCYTHWPWPCVTLIPPWTLHIFLLRGIETSAKRQILIKTDNYDAPWPRVTLVWPWTLHVFWRTTETFAIPQSRIPITKTDICDTLPSEVSSSVKPVQYSVFAVIYMYVIFVTCIIFLCLRQYAEYSMLFVPSVS